MGAKQVRLGQLIAPFGPGSIYTDRMGVPHVVGGLDFWFRSWDSVRGRAVDCSDRSEFERFEPRLAALLRVNRFCSPPDYRQPLQGSAPAPNAGLKVPALRFPRWYRHTKTGELRRFNLHSTILPPVPGGRWQPVRFIAVCQSGHLGEFPWKEWISCSCTNAAGLVLIDRGGSELSSIKIECKSCPAGSSGRKGRTLAGTTLRPDVESGEQSAFEKAGIACAGDRPWLGEGANEPGCMAPLVGALINQTNIYLPLTVSAISLPLLPKEEPEVLRLCAELQQEASALGIALTRWRMGKSEQSDVVADMQRKLLRRGIEAADVSVRSALEALFSGMVAESGPQEAAPAEPESELLKFRRDEFNVLRCEVDDPEGVPDLRVIDAGVPEGVAAWIGRVTLVERLKETRAFYGFDRLVSRKSPLSAMPQSALEQLFRWPPTEEHERWLPAIEVFGEGVYLELRENAIHEWMGKYSSWIEHRLSSVFLLSLGGVYNTMPPLKGISKDWAARYLLVHSLAHILSNQLVFECGYSSASLRERIFVSSDPVAPMAGLLLYTAAGDSEGTLGGLVRLGRRERLEPLIVRALGRAAWCSADPVCSEQLGGQGAARANLAACHACILLPETSCETINNGLDRALVVGTPDARESGFMSALLSNVYMSQ